MLVLVKINENYPDFTRGEKKIADYIIKNGNVVAFSTLEEVADKAGVSTTSVIRFARTLGFEGYTQMQQSIQKELMKKVSLPERYEGSYPKIEKGHLLDDILTEEIDRLKKTVKYVSAEALDQAVSAISGARRIYILGCRATFSLACYTAAYMSQICDNVTLVGGIGGMHPEELVNAGEGDVCIAFMFPRYQKIMVNSLEWLKSRNVKTVIISTPANDTIRHLGDIFLFCGVENGIMSKDSLIPAMFLSNYLITAVMAEDYENTKNRLALMEEILEKGSYLSI